MPKSYLTTAERESAHAMSEKRKRSKNRKALILKWASYMGLNNITAIEEFCGIAPRKLYNALNGITQMTVELAYEVGSKLDFDMDAYGRLIRGD